MRFIPTTIKFIKDKVLDYEIDNLIKKSINKKNLKKLLKKIKNDK